MQLSHELCWSLVKFFNVPENEILASHSLLLLGVPPHSRDVVSLQWVLGRIGAIVKGINLCFIRLGASHKVSDGRLPLGGLALGPCNLVCVFEITVPLES